MERTEFQQMMADLKEQSERRRYDALRKKYAIAPDFTNMSLYDELGARYDLDELEQLKQKYGSNNPFDNTNSYTTESAWGYPNNTQSPYYQKMGRPYDINYLSETNRNNIDYSLYGDGFSKEFIDEMLNDEDFQKVLKEYIIPNEGGYNNDSDDPGSETNMGIAKTAHQNEDVTNMTRERANAIYYKDYYKWNGLNKLPYPIRGFVVDYGLPTYPQYAVETVHKVLNLPSNSDIIGPTTLGIFENYTDEDYKDFLEKYRKEMKQHFNDVAQRDPNKRKFLRGWLNRADGAHLAK